MKLEYMHKYLANDNFYIVDNGPLVSALDELGSLGWDVFQASEETANDELMGWNILAKRTVEEE